VRISVLAKTRAKIESVEKIDATHYKIAVKELPIKGAANLAIIKKLADYLNIAPSRLRIVMGSTTKNKVIEIIE